MARLRLAGLGGALSDLARRERNSETIVSFGPTDRVASGEGVADLEESGKSGRKIHRNSISS